MLFNAFQALAEVTVAITPFEAQGYSLKKHTAYARGALEDIVMEQDNVTVVERARMDEMTKEGTFGNFSGLADPSTSIKFGKMSGAQILFTGSILKVDTEKKGFSGFGVSASSKSTLATVRVRAYNAEKGTVIFSKTLKGSNSSFSTSYGGSGDADPASMAIEDAISKLNESKKFAKLFINKQPKKNEVSMVSVEFAPQPDNTDVEVNGVYYGSTPMNIDLPSGSPIKVKLSKPGFVIWEKSLFPRDGMKVNTELEKEVK
jgi:hypothetical protein